MVELVSECELVNFYLSQPNVYPRRKFLCIEARAKSIELQINRKKRKYNHAFCILGLYFCYILLRSDTELRIQGEVKPGWYSPPFFIKFTSKPLTLDEIYEIYESLKKDRINVEVNVQAYGFLREAEKYGLSPWTLTTITLTLNDSISKMEFVKNVLEQADMLKRRFLEVVIEPIRQDVLDKVSDPDVREAMRILVKKQNMLQEALESLYKATTYHDYVSTIGLVRNAIEGIIKPKKPSEMKPSEKIFKAIEKAYRGLGVAEEITPGALDDLVRDLNDVLDKTSNNLYKFASKLGSHGKKTGSGKLYNPRPWLHDAEFAVLQAMLFLNYMIKLLQRYVIRK